MTRRLGVLIVAAVVSVGMPLRLAAQSISVFPDGTTQTKSPNTTTSVSFGVVGTQSGQSYSREIVCSGQVINCSSPTPSFFSGPVSGITVNFSTTAAGTARIRLRVWQTPGSSDSGWINLNVGTYGVSVTPELATSASRPAGTGPYSETFTISNSGTIQDTYSFSCSANWVTCGTVPSPVTLAGGTATTVSMPYTVGTTVTTGTLTLTAFGSGGNDQGQYQIPIIGYNVSVSPKAGSEPIRNANTAGYTTFFDITNTAADNTYNLQCPPDLTAPGISCVGFSPASPVFIPGGQTQRVTVTYNTGGSTSGRITLRATGTGAGASAQDDGYRMVQVASYGVAVTPDGGVEPTRAANTGGYSVSFNVNNSGTLTENFSFSCVGSNGVTCTSSPAPLDIAPGGGGVNVSVTYNVGAANNNGGLQLTATSAHTSDFGTYTVPIATFSVSVSPDGSTAPSRNQNTSGYSESFTISNGGTVANTFTFTCTGSNGVSCGTVPAPLTVNPGAPQSVSMPYGVGGPNTGRLALKATGSGGASDSGWYNVPIACTTCFSIVPDGTTLVRSTDTTATVSFGGIGLTSGQSYSREILCSGPVINCSSTVPDFFTYTSGMSIPVTYTTASTPGAAQVRLRVYQGGGGSDSGWYNITVTSYGVAVTPDGDSTVQRLANTGGHVDSFTVTNTGSASNTFSFSCGSAGTVGCGSPVPGPVTIGAGGQVKVGMPYSVGDYTQPNRLFLTATGTKASDQGFYNVRVLSYRVSVTPKGGSAPPRAQNTGGYSERFTISNGGSTNNTFSFTCVGSGGVTCGTPMPPPLTLGPLAYDSVAIPYSVGATGTGTLIVRVSGTNTSDTGYVSVPIVRYGVAVTPDGGQTQNRPQNTGGYSESFTVTNTGTVATDFTFTCIGATGVTCGTAPATINVKPDSSKTVSMPYGVGTPQMGKLTLRASGPGVSDTGFYNVVIVCTVNCFTIVPDGTTLVRSTDTTATVSFGGIGLTSGQSYSREILCSGPVINCSSTVPDFFTYTSGMSIPVTYTTASTPGAAQVRLRVYQGGGGSDSGWYNITVTSYGVAVTPDGLTSAQRLANTTGHSESFVVRNTGSADNTYALSCTNVGTVLCSGSPVPASVTLGPGRDTTVSVTYGVGDYAIPNRLFLTANGTKVSDQGFYNVSVLSYRVSVWTAASTTPARVANTSGHSEPFTVSNDGSTDNTFTFTCIGAQGVTCGGPIPGPLTLASFTQGTVDIPYSVGAAGTGTLTLIVSGTNASDTSTVTVPIVAYGVAVTPDGATAPSRVANTSGLSETFTVRNTGQTSNSYTLSCGIADVPVTCTGVNPPSVTLAAGDSTPASATYNVGAAGTGTLRLKADGSNATDEGSYSVKVIRYGVAVTPDGNAAPARAANTTGHSESFTIQNTGTDSTIYTLTCGAVAPVTCVGVTPASVTLAPNGTASAAATFNVGAVGSGTVRLIAAGPGGVADTGSYSVQVICSTCFAPSTIAGGLFTKDSRYVLVETANIYSTSGQLTQHTNARGKITNYLYGGNSNNAFLIKVTRVHDGTGTVDLITAIGYDNRGQVDTMKDEGGTSRYFFYDAYGRLTQVRNNAGTPVHGYAYVYSRTGPNWTFDPANPNAVIDTTYLQQTPSVQSVVRAEYVDGLGRSIQSVVRDGANSHVTLTQYDAMGRVWRSWKPFTRAGFGFDATASADATSFYNTYHGSSAAKPYIESTYSSDASARVKQVTPEYIGATGTASLRVYGVDVANRQTFTETTDESGKRTRQYADLFGYQVRTLLGYGAPEQTTTQHVYDVTGKLTQTTDPRGLVTSYARSTRGFLTSRTSPDVGTMASKFDRAGYLRYVQDANQAIAGQVYFTNYDFAGRVLTSGVGQATFATLDPDTPTPPALETTQANWLGVQAYDARPSTTVYPWSLFGTQISGAAVTNVMGRLAAVASKSNGAWQVTLFSYDGDGQIVTRYVFTQANSGSSVLTALNTTVGYTRDLRGSLTQRALTVGSKKFNHWYDYDARGLLWKVFASTTTTKPTTADVTDTYLPSGQPQNYQFLGGPLVPLRYTIRGQTAKVGDPALTIYPFSARYAYQLDGVVDTLEFYSAGAPVQKRYRYAFGPPAYDALNRLKAADYSSWNGTAWSATLAYDLTGINYDAAGNLVSLQRYRGNGTLLDNLTYTNASTSNRLSSITDGVAATSESWDAETGGFSYDANGNVKTAPAPFSITAATYDASNLPLAITRAGVSTKYRYDDDGQRISKQTGTGNTEVYLRDGSTTLGVFTVKPQGSLASWYFNLLWEDRVVGRQPETGSRLYYHFDHLGSTRAVVRGSTVVESYDFEPWGLLMPGRTLGTGTKEGFTGKEQDSESALAYYGARYYMPAVGRWASADPLADNAPEWSAYAYASDGPTFSIDPTGRQTESAIYFGLEAQQIFRSLQQRIQQRANRPREPNPLESNPACQPAQGGNFVSCTAVAVAPIKKLEPVALLVASLPTFVATEGISVALQLAPSLATRATAIQAAVGAARSGRTTTAVIQAVKGDGTLVRVVGSSEGRLRTAQAAALETGEVAAIGTRGVHAEVNAIQYAQAQGWRVIAVAASRPICGGCLNFLLSAGARAASPLK